VAELERDEKNGNRLGTGWEPPGNTLPFFEIVSWQRMKKAGSTWLMLPAWKC